MRKLLFVLLLLSITIQAEAQITGGGKGNTNSSQSNNNDSDDGELGPRTYFFWGYGLSNTWASNDLEVLAAPPSLLMNWAFGINEQMSWGMGFHVGYVEAMYSYAFDNDYVDYLHWSVSGQYYYHFLPRTSRIDLSAVASIGYAKATIMEEESVKYYNREGLRKNGIKLGLSGVAKIRLGRRFGVYAKAGYDPAAGHVQVGLAWGK